MALGHRAAGPGNEVGLCPVIQLLLPDALVAVSEHPIQAIVCVPAFGAEHRSLREVQGSGYLAGAPALLMLRRNFLKVFVERDAVVFEWPLSGLRQVQGFTLVPIPPAGCIWVDLDRLGRAVSLPLPRCSCIPRRPVWFFDLHSDSPLYLFIAVQRSEFEEPSGWHHADQGSVPDSGVFLDVLVIQPFCCPLHRGRVPEGYFPPSWPNISPPLTDGGFYQVHYHVDSSLGWVDGLAVRSVGDDCGWQLDLKAEGAVVCS